MLPGLICCEEGLIKAKLEDPDEKRLISSDYSDLAEMYYCAKEYKKALQAVEDAIASGNLNEEENLIIRSLSLLKLGEVEKAVYSDTLQQILAYMLKEIEEYGEGTWHSATEEERKTLQKISKYSLPDELQKFYHCCLPDKTLALYELTLLGIEELKKYNCQREFGKFLCEQGFFVIGIGDCGNVYFVDLLDENHPVYQCSESIVNGKQFTIYTSRDKEVHVPITRETIQKTSSLHDVHFLFFLYTFAEGMIEDEEEEMFYRKYCS